MLNRNDKRIKSFTHLRISTERPICILYNARIYASFSSVTFELAPI